MCSSFKYTVGSDHAGLLLTIPTSHEPPPLPAPTRWKIDPLLPPSPCGLAWWNDACKVALADTQDTHGNERRLKVQVLRAMIKRAKTAWFEALLDDPDTNLWDLAKWRHGQWRTTIPTLSPPPRLPQPSPALPTLRRRAPRGSATSSSSGASQPDRTISPPSCRP